MALTLAQAEQAFDQYTGRQGSDENRRIPPLGFVPVEITFTYPNRLTFHGASGETREMNTGNIGQAQYDAERLSRSFGIPARELQEGAAYQVTGPGTTTQTTVVPVAGTSTPTPTVQVAGVLPPTQELGPRVPNVAALKEGKYKEGDLIRRGEAIYLKPGVPIRWTEQTAIQPTIPVVPPSGVPSQPPQQELGTYVPDPAFLKFYKKDEIIRQPDGKIYLKPGIPIRWTAITPAAPAPTPTAPSIPTPTPTPSPETVSPPTPAPLTPGAEVSVFGQPPQPSTQTIVDAILEGVDADVKNLITQMTDQFGEALKAWKEGQAINEEELNKQFEELKIKNINPYFKQLITNYQTDLLANLGALTGQRKLELEAQQRSFVEETRKARAELEASGMTFTGEALRLLGAESAFAPRAVRVPTLPEELAVEEMPEGEIPVSQRILATSRQERYKQELRKLAVEAERELGTANIPAEYSKYQAGGAEPITAEFLTGKEIGEIERKKREEELATQEALRGSQRATSAFNVLAQPIKYAE